MAYAGGCQCGAIRYRFESEPVVVRACWCRDCQRIACGSASVNAMFPTEGMIVEGEAGDFAYSAQSGTPMHRRFCAACGANLFSQAETRPHLIGVRVGSLDDPQALRPEMTIWTVSAPPWAAIDPDIPSYQGQPPPPATAK